MWAHVLKSTSRRRETHRLLHNRLFFVKEIPVKCFCPLRSLCHKFKYNRIIERNHNLIRLKSQARTLLTSEQGIAKRKQRCWDVEAVFGNIKQNMNFKRFMLRGIDKVNVEIGLIAMAHNLKKYSLTI